MYICSMIFKELFSDLEFIEETHKYTLDGVLIPSMSSKIELLYKKFDTDFYAPLTAKKENKSVDAVLHQWDFLKTLGIDIGNDTHNYAETKKGKVTSTFKEAVNQFHLDLEPRYSIVEEELRMYSRRYWVAGTTDLILFDNIKQHYILADYKTNKDLFKSFGQDLFSPFGNYINNPFNKYIVQLNGYQLMLEEKGVEIKERWLIWLSSRSNHSLYKMFLVPDELENTKIHFNNTYSKC